MKLLISMVLYTYLGFEAVSFDSVMVLGLFGKRTALLKSMILFSSSSATTRRWDGDVILEEWGNSKLRGGI